MAELVSRDEDAGAVTFSYVADGQTGQTVVTVYKTNPASWRITLPAEVQPQTWEEIVTQFDTDLGVI